MVRSVYKQSALGLGQDPGCCCNSIRSWQETTNREKIIAVEIQFMEEMGKNGTVLLFHSHTLVTFSCLKRHRDSAECQASSPLVLGCLFLSKLALQRWNSFLRAITGSRHNFANKSTSRTLFRAAPGRQAHLSWAWIYQGRCEGSEGKEELISNLFYKGLLPLHTQ